MVWGWVAVGVWTLLLEINYLAKKRCYRKESDRRLKSLDELAESLRKDRNA